MRHQGMNSLPYNAQLVLGKTGVTDNNFRARMIYGPDACKSRIVRLYSRSIRKISSKQEKKRVYRDSGPVEGLGPAGKAEE